MASTVKVTNTEEEIEDIHKWEDSPYSYWNSQFYPVTHRFCVCVCVYLNSNAFNKGKGAWEIAQSLRAITVLERDLGLVPNIHGWLTTTCHSSSKGSDVLLASVGTCIHMVMDIISQVCAYTLEEGWVGSQKTLSNQSCLELSKGSMQEAWQFLHQNSMGQQVNGHAE